MDGVDSKDFIDQTCNCHSKTEVDGQCVYGGDCRKSVAVYKATCRECGMYYVGCTQNDLKTRMNKHFGEARALVRIGKKSDSFAKHFAGHFGPDVENVHCHDVREKVLKVEILWQGKPLVV